MKGDFSRQTFDPKKHYSRVLMQQGRVQLDADWNEQQSIHRHRLETEAADVIGLSGGPAGSAGFGITVQQDGKTLVIGKGRYYSHGILCENEADVSYDKQPDLSNPPDVVTALGVANATVGLVYLDEWQRHVTALDDPLVREVALGGPDSTTRAKTVWQVKILPVKPQDPSVVRCDDSFPEWDDLTSPSSGALSARAQPTAAVDNPCLLPPSAGYRRLENQLYRVEVHKPGSLGTATFKWSRDNGTVVTAIEKLSGQEVTVRDVGPDDFLGFANGQWVEIVSDDQELNGQPGQLAQIDAVNPSTRVITLKSAPPPVDLARHPKLRRWDSAAETAVAVPSTNGGWIPLEDGVEVQFSAGSYRTGDYWLIPARTVTGDVEWPSTDPQPSLGIKHCLCRLALLQLNSQTKALSVQGDCRKLFLPLADVPPALHVIGINWLNDDVMTLEHLTSAGLQVVLDGTPVSQSVSAASLIVTLELPVLSSTDAAAARPHVNAVLSNDKDVSVTSNLIQWKPALADLSPLLTLLAGQTSPRVRFTLKGHAIWGVQDNQRLYLDGQVFGQPGLTVDNKQRTDLAFPSGDGARASDFASWFFLAQQIPPPSLVTFLLGSDTVLAGATVTGTVTLSSPAPGAGVVVNLASKDTAVTLPATVTVAAGQTAATVTVTTNAAAIPNTKSVILEASFAGVTLQATLAVQVVSVTISPTQVTLFTGRGQQFTAAVAGTPSTDVGWSVQEVNGGSINTAGLYVAPGAPGTFHVMATSTADPTKTATATVSVVPKPKEGKEHKDKDKDVVKEKDIVDTHPNVSVVRGVGPGSGPGLSSAPAVAGEKGGETVTPVGRAFIRPEERPPVGAGVLKRPDS